VNSTTGLLDASGTRSDEPARPSPWRRSYPGAVIRSQMYPTKIVRNELANNGGTQCCQCGFFGNGGG